MRRRRANAGDVRGARQDFGGDHPASRAVFTQTLVSSQRPPTFLHSKVVTILTAWSHAIAEHWMITIFVSTTLC
jgi:hypothetical protein